LKAQCRRAEESEKKLNVTETQHDLIVEGLKAQLEQSHTACELLRQEAKALADAGVLAARAADIMRSKPTGPSSVDIDKLKEEARVVNNRCIDLEDLLENMRRKEQTFVSDQKVLFLLIFICNFHVLNHFLLI
jgi:hypothetical protein